VTCSPAGAEKTCQRHDNLRPGTPKYEWEWLESLKRHSLKFVDTFVMHMQAKDLFRSPSLRGANWTKMMSRHWLRIQYLELHL
jgi:hypothetical protein